MTITIYRAGSPNITVGIGEGSKMLQSLNGEDVCNINFRVPQVVDLQIGDEVTIFSRLYKLNILPTIKKIASNQYYYECTFESRQYELGKVMFLDSLSGGEFFLTGDLDFFVSQVVVQLNRVQTGWSKGTIKSGTLTKNLQFSNENCLGVLQRLCQEYEVDFSISESKVINATTIGTASGLTFQYGQGKGLYSLTRKTVDSKNIFTRLYAFGSTRNIPANYRGYSTRLKFASGYLERNTATYGVIEASKYFDDIYPRFNGTVTGVDGPSLIRCSSLDFDLNSYLLEGMTAKVHFNSGPLMGYEFEIASYNHVIKQISLIPTDQEKIYDNSGLLSKYTIPNIDLMPAVGNSFVFLDIKMPDSYITAAESELQTAAQAFLDANSDPRVGYELEIDPIYVKNNPFILAVGDSVSIVDAPMGINKNVRISSITREITNAYDWKVELSNFIDVSVIDRAIADVDDIKRVVLANRLNDIARARRSWRNSEELKNYIFDPEGYFDGGRIKPETVDTLMLTVGAKGTQFVLRGIILEANYQGDKAQFNILGGSLVHYGLPTVTSWTIPNALINGLSDSSVYYIYAKCHRFTLTDANIVLDTVQRRVDSVANYYYFWIGVLHSVVSGVRDISLTYGSSRINGRTITTGKITSQDGLTSFDLDAGKISGKIEFGSCSSGFDNIADAPLVPMNDSLELRYSFDQDGISMVADESSNKLNGDILGTKGTHWDWDTGISSRAFKVLSGGNGYIQALADGTGKFNKQVFTIAGWMRTHTKPGTTSYGFLFSYDFTSHAAPYYAAQLRTEYNLANDTMRVVFGFNISGSVKVIQKIDIPWANWGTTWHHLAITFTSGTQKLFIDGVEVASGAEVGTITYYTQEVWIGRMNSGVAYHPFTIDDIRYYSRVLDPKEILGLYKGLGNAATKTTIDGGLVTTGRIELGDGTTIKAGINGSGTSNSDIRFWAGDTFTNRASAPFRILQDGQVIASAGLIAGWSINSGYLAKDTGADNTSSGMSPTDFPFYAGATYSNRASAPFRVTPAGVLTASLSNSVFRATPVTSGTYRGAVKIEGNQIWEDAEDSDTTGYILINYNKGYNGGTTRYRSTYIGNGKGTALFGITGASTSQAFFGTDQLFINSSYIGMGAIPSSPPTEVGRLYKDSNGFVRIKL